MNFLFANQPTPEEPASLVDRFRETAGPPLKSLLEPLDAFLAHLPPPAWRACAAGLILIVAVAMLFLRREFIFRGAPDQARWRDLRIWALLAAAPYVVIYLFFF